MAFGLDRLFSREEPKPASRPGGSLLGDLRPLPKREKSKSTKEERKQEPSPPPKNEAESVPREQPTASSGTSVVFLGDCLEVMRGMESETVDLIPVDPLPFHRKHRKKHGEGSRYSEFHDDARRLDPHEEEWYRRQECENRRLFASLRLVEELGNRELLAYFIFLAQRLEEMKRLLKPTGLLFLHCETQHAHFFRVILDSLFGGPRFRNQVSLKIGKKVRPSPPGSFPVRLSSLLVYGKSNEARIHAPAIGDLWEEPITAEDRKLKWPGLVPASLAWKVVYSGSPEGGTVLDPFCGSGAFLRSAGELGREWIGIEVEPTARAVITSRIPEASFSTVFPTRETEDPAPVKLAAYKPYFFWKGEGKCARCGTHFADPRHLTVDHIVPRSRGGSDHHWNGQLLCAPCNSSKGSRLENPKEYDRHG